MPYIKQTERAKFKECLPEVGKLCDTCGELNYVFTCIAHEYIKRHGLKYQNINDIIGALEGAKIEFYRKVGQDYEDIKIKENGDVGLFEAP